MNKELFEDMIIGNKKHWWQLGRKTLFKNLYLEYTKSFKGSLNILDIGCGMGLMLSEFDCIKNNVYGIENEDIAVDYCRKNFDATIIKKNLLDEIPFVDEKFDFITCLDVLEHIDDDVGSLNIIREYLKNENSELVISVPAFPSLWTKSDYFAGHKRRYTKKCLVDKINAAGYKISRVTYFNSLLFVFIFIVRKLQRILNFDIKGLKTPPKPINFILKKIFLFEISILSKINFGWGVSLLIVCNLKNK